MDKKKLEFGVLTLLLCVSRIWDTVATYYVTPDLASETNPVVSLFGQGWPVIIGVQIIFVSAIVILNYYSLFKSRTIHPVERDLTFVEFTTVYYLGSKQSMTNMLYKLPHRWHVFAQVFGYCLPRALIVVGFLVSISSTFLLISSGYRDFYSAAMPYLYAVAVVMALYYFLSFFRKEYAVYKQFV